MAAATAGLTRCVRPPLPWRPSKLRLLVLALRSPGLQDVGVHAQAHRAAGAAPLEAGLAEDPVEALALGLRFTATLPGTTSARRPGATFRPPTMPAATRRSSIREFVHEPMKIVSGRMSRIARARLEVHVGERPAAASRFDGSLERVGIGHRAVDRHRLRGVGAPAHVRLAARCVEHRPRVERGPVVGRQGAPVVERGFPSGARRRVRAALDVGERRVVGRDHAGPGAALDRHVADRHAPFHRERADRRPAVLDDVADAAAGPDAVDDRQDDVLGPAARRAVRPRP